MSPAYTVNISSYWQNFGTRNVVAVAAGNPARQRRTKGRRVWEGAPKRPPKKSGKAKPLRDAERTSTGSRCRNAAGYACPLPQVVRYAHRLAAIMLHRNGKPCRVYHRDLEGKALRSFSRDVAWKTLSGLPRSPAPFTSTTLCQKRVICYTLIRNGSRYTLLCCEGVRDRANPLARVSRLCRSVGRSVATGYAVTVGTAPDQA